MAKYVKVVALNLEPESSLLRASEFLCCIGYEVLSSNPRKIIMKYQGKFFTLNDTESSHKLVMTATNKQIVFQFSNWESFFFSRSDKEVFTQRVENALTGLAS